MQDRDEQLLQLKVSILNSIFDLLISEFLTCAAQLHLCCTSIESSATPWPRKSFVAAAQPSPPSAWPLPCAGAAGGSSRRSAPLARGCRRSCGAAAAAVRCTACAAGRGAALRRARRGPGSAARGGAAGAAHSSGRSRGPAAAAAGRGIPGRGRRGCSPAARGALGALWARLCSQPRLCHACPGSCGEQVVKWSTACAVHPLVHSTRPPVTLHPVHCSLIASSPARITSK